MNKKEEYLIDLIFNKLKSYKAKEIILEKENLKRFVFSLLKESWKVIVSKTVIVKKICSYVYE